MPTRAARFAFLAAVLLPAVALGCVPIPLTEDGGPDAELSAWAREEWHRLDGHLATRVVAYPAPSLPFAVGDGRELAVWLPPGLPEPLARAVMRYELRKAKVQMDTAAWPWPLNWIAWTAALIHDPVTEWLSWEAVLDPPPAKPPPVAGAPLARRP